MTCIVALRYTPPSIPNARSHLACLHCTSLPPPSALFDHHLPTHHTKIHAPYLAHTYLPSATNNKQLPVIAPQTACSYYSTRQGCRRRPWGRKK